MGVGRHNSSCAGAMKHDCRCSGCGGTLHGWVERIKLARESAGDGRVAFRVRVDEAWADAHKGKTRARPSLRKQAAGTDSAVVDIVDWLAHHHAVVDEVEAIAKILGDEVLQELDRSLDPSHREDRRRAFADHLWCDLLAGMAQALEDYDKQLQRIPDHITALILVARERDGRSAVEDFQVKLAVNEAWKVIQELPFVKALLPEVGELLRAIRILAILICPAPEHHREVIVHCVNPLRDELVSEATQERLERVLPSKWLPGE